VLVPAHGNIMDEPQAAIDALADRLDACYDRYVAISALRHYFPELFEEFQGRPGHMPIRPGRPAPDCLLHLGTSWVILSRDKAAFVIDCGHERRIDDLKKLIGEGRVKSVDGFVDHALPRRPHGGDPGVSKIVRLPLLCRPARGRGDRQPDRLANPLHLAERRPGRQGPRSRRVVAIGASSR
jgi:hypothetical protein